MRKHFWTGLSVLLAILSIALGMYAIKSKEPVYAVKGMNLVSSSLSQYGNLKISFGDKPVRQVTVTYVGLANDGREPIRREDIASKDPIRICMRGGAKMLSCKIVGVSNKVIDASLVGPSLDEPEVRFEYLGERDWIGIQVLHTGAKADDCQLRGTVIGCGEIRQDGGTIRARLDRLRWLGLVIATYIVTLSIQPLRLFWKFRGEPLDSRGRSLLKDTLLLTVLSIVFLAIVTIVSWRMPDSFSAVRMALPK